MDVIVLIGRLLFAVLILGSAYAHFAQREPMSQYAAAKGVPMPKESVLGGGVLLALGGISVLFGIWPDFGALLLAIFLIPTAILMHPFWKETDPQAKMMEMVQFNKDIGLAGASLMLLGLFAIAGDDLGLTLTGPLFG